MEISNTALFIIAMTIIAVALIKSDNIKIFGLKWFNSFLGGEFHNRK